MTAIKIIDETSTWQSGFEQRVRDWYASVGLGEGALTWYVERARRELADWTVAEIADDDGAPVGYVAAGVREAYGAPMGSLGDLWTVPGAEQHRAAAREWAERWCAEHGARQLSVRMTTPDDTFADYNVGAQTRLKVIGAPLSSERLTARPMTAEEYPAWVASEKAGYAADMVRSGSWTPEEAQTKSDSDFAKLLPQGLETPGHTVTTTLAGGEPVGTGWLHHGHQPGVTFGFSLHIAPEHRGKGYGRDSMALGEQATLAGGDTALMFNVFGGNEVAMNLYTTAGYAVIEEGRSIDL
ncbi:GNAT family N-acetyltransferase [Kitasatospora sp. McL0602]|uniref:GNAT family N-acetyltransferase n=1 Tax=Kitasatospora sp. McL0602 TaxID=3439530 RepID=UPI003F8AC8E3